MFDKPACRDLFDVSRRFRTLQQVLHSRLSYDFMHRTGRKMGPDQVSSYEAGNEIFPASQAWTP